MKTIVRERYLERAKALKDTPIIERQDTMAEYLGENSEITMDSVMSKAKEISLSTVAPGECLWIEDKDELLPIIQNDILLDTEEGTLEKVAQFDYDAPVYIYDDEWHVHIDGEVYIIFNEGREVKQLICDDIAEDEENEEATEAEKQFVIQYESVYCDIKLIGNNKFLVTESGADLDTMKIVDINNNPLSEEYHDIYGWKGPFVTKRWINGERKCGLIDENGKVIIEGAFYISSTHFPVCSEKRRRVVICHNNKFGVIDFDGNIIVYPSYRDIHCISGDLIVALRFDGREVLISETGENLLIADSIQICDDTIVVKNDGCGAEVYKYIKKSNYVIHHEKVEELFKKKKDDSEDAASVKAYALERLGDLISRLTRLHLAQKVISSQTADEVLEIISGKSWDEKRELANKLIYILDNSITEEEILGKIKEL